MHHLFDTYIVPGTVSTTKMKTSYGPPGTSNIMVIKNAATYYPYSRFSSLPTKGLRPNKLLSEEQGVDCRTSFTTNALQLTTDPPKVSRLTAVPRV